MWANTQNSYEAGVKELYFLAANVCVCKEREKVKTEKTVSVAGIREAQSRELLWSLEQWKIHFTCIVAQKLEVLKT